jgi:hypothetical protein
MVGPVVGDRVLRSTKTYQAISWDTICSGTGVVLRSPVSRLCIKTYHNTIRPPAVGAPAGLQWKTTDVTATEIDQKRCHYQPTWVICWDTCVNPTRGCCTRRSWTFSCGEDTGLVSDLNSLHSQTQQGRTWHRTHDFHQKTTH